MGILSYKDLLVWQLGHELVITIYEETKNFPASEQFGLTNQLRRAAVSVTSNIAEGFVRKNKKEKIQFYFMSLGSLTELNNQIQISRDVKYVSDKKFLELEDKTVRVGKLINSLIKSTEGRNFS